MVFFRYGLLCLSLFAVLLLSWNCSESPQTKIKFHQFFYYDLSDRVATLQEAKAVIRSRYALLEIKKKRLGIDADKLFAEAVAHEKDFEDTNSALEQARSNLAFFDRLRALLANFQDSHLNSNPVTPLPEIYLGFELTQVGKGFYIDFISDRIAELGRRNQVTLDRSTQVVAIDDISVETKMIDLAKYVYASSPGNRRKQALKYLTSRSFHYPSSSVSSVTFRTQTGQIVRLKLRWKYRYTHVRLDALYYLEKLGFNHLEIPVPSEIRSRAARTELEESERWYGISDPNKVVFRTGLKSVGENRVGFVQLFSFYERQVMTEAGEDIQDWLSPLAKFIKKLEDNKTPLIIDLRQNEGGHVELPTELMALLARKDEIYPSYTEAYRLTPGIKQMWQRINPEHNPHSRDAIAAGLIQKSMQNDQTYSDVWSKSLPIGADIIHGSFNQQIAVWLGPECLSACDILALLFERSSRAKLIGEKSGGTGAGYLNWEPYLDARWTDLRHIVQLDIPNMMFGHSESAKFRFASGGNAVFRFNRENIPVIPHIPYQKTLQDHLKYDSQMLDYTYKIFDF